MKKKYLVFDLDGTLVDSLPGIAEGVNRALSQLGRPTHSPEEVRSMIGSGAANLCARAIGYPDAEQAPQEELEAVHSLFRREYPLCWQGERTRPYPGISRMLCRLLSAGCHLAVLSNKPHEVTEPMVRTLFPAIPFSPVMGFTGQFPRKPSPEALCEIARRWNVSPSELTLIGDSLYDAHTAANAGCELALVAWGYARIPDLAAWGAPLFGSVDELRFHLLGYH